MVSVELGVSEYEFSWFKLIWAFEVSCKQINAENIVSSFFINYSFSFPLSVPMLGPNYCQIVVPDSCAKLLNCRSKDK